MTNEGDILIEDIMKDDEKEMVLHIQENVITIKKPTMVQMDKIMRYCIKQLQGINQPEEAPPEIELNIISFIIYTLQEGTNYSQEEIYNKINSLGNYIEFINIKKAVNDFVFSWQYEIEEVKKK